jgi:hypothetical protein
MAGNQIFLDAAIRRGGDVLFAGWFGPSRLNPNSILAFEVRYLQQAGYRWTDDFSALVPWQFNMNPMISQLVNSCFHAFAEKHGLREIEEMCHGTSEAAAWAWA